jgi:hypothetical protein
MAGSHCDASIAALGRTNTNSRFRQPSDGGHWGNPAHLASVADSSWAAALGLILDRTASLCYRTRPAHGDAQGA